MRLIVLMSIIISAINSLTFPPVALGAKGEKGDLGLPGATGPPGAAGVTGEPGEKGQKGDQGFKGDSGPPGLEGDTGDMGLPGDTGARGAIGADGETGATGPKGPDSLNLTGDVGPPGDPGVKGVKGEPGVPGQRGMIGDRGQKGGPGLQGWPGQIGQTGEQGIQGDAGDPGRTLFEIDEDECLSSNLCDDLTTNCINQATGYMCECKPGFQPATNVTCTDIDECSVSNGGCSHKCENITGSFVCSCPAGTQISGNRRSCLDINECSRTIDNSCSDIDICVNTFQSYECVDANEGTPDSGSSAAQTDQLKYVLLTNAAIWVIIIWLALVTVSVMIILIWLVVMLRRNYSKSKSVSHPDRAAYSNDALSDSQSIGPVDYSEPMREQGTMDIDIPKLPPSQKNTMKGSSRKAYNSRKNGSSVGRSSRPPSAASYEGDRTASVRSTRAAASERLSNVDIHY